MRDNTATKLDRGPTGVDDRIVNVESARSSVAAIDYHQSLDSETRPGRRPAHMAGLYLEGTFTASKLRGDWEALNLQARIFDRSKHRAIIRLSPMRTHSRNSPFDLHGISVRIWSTPKGTKGKDTDYSDFVALNTHPFPFRNADDFATFFHRLRSGVRSSVIAFGAFFLGSLGGNASVVGLWRAARAAFGAKKPLKGRMYWGIHTFFADVTHSKHGDLSVPYRLRFRIRRTCRSTPRSDERSILARYRDLAEEIAPKEGEGRPADIDMYLQIPWRYERLSPWNRVPQRIRDNLINPQADWQRARWVRVGSITAKKVVDRNGIDGAQTSPAWDNLMFDPTRLAEGLHASDDPLLVARAGAYAESHMRSYRHEDKKAGEEEES